MLCKVLPAGRNRDRKEHHAIAPLPVAVTKRPAIISRSVAGDAAGTGNVCPRFTVRKQAIYGNDQMPWTPNDAERHTHKATTTELKELWAKVANEALQRTGDEGRAIREANAVVARQTEQRLG
jgi:hypothetical protein